MTWSYLSHIIWILFVSVTFCCMKRLKIHKCVKEKKKKKEKDWFPFPRRSVRSTLNQKIVKGVLSLTGIWFSTKHFQKQNKQEFSKLCADHLYLASRKHTVICFCHIIPLGDKNKCRWSTKENALKICTSACIKGHWIVFVSCNKVVPVYNINKKGLPKWSTKLEKGKFWQILYSQGAVNSYYQLDFTFLIFPFFWLSKALNQQKDS